MQTVGIKDRLSLLIEKACQPHLSSLDNVDSGLERTRDAAHGDFACNLAMRHAKTLKMPPRALATTLLDAILDCDRQSNEPILESAVIAGPGFINLTLKNAVYTQELHTILTRREHYGEQNFGQGQKVLLEFVSANPTGPLHVGHGRHAAYGAVLSNLLQKTGHDVSREFYINDAGRQVDILGVSVWIRYLNLQNAELPFPSNGYKGDYLLPIAHHLLAAHGNAFWADPKAVMDGVPADEPHGGDKEQHIDALIEKAQQLCGDSFKKIIDHALAGMQADIKEDLQALGVTFDTWFSERSLSETGKIEQAFQLLEKNDQTYLKDGALWFKAQALGDDEDRVVRRDNGLTTYFASDIAYHLDKRLRGFDHLIDVWGADHHGYIARVKAGLSAMGQPPDSLEVVLLQLVNLYSSGQKLAMGKREGNFVTLRQLREEVGADACRFYYVARSHDQTLDFDLDLAKKRSNENPVFYIQYAHARIASFEKQLNARGLSYDATMGLKHLDVLSLSHERQLMAILSQFPEALALAARSRAPHTLVQYCRDLAHEFHLNYAKGNENPAYRMIVDDEHLRNARLTLAKATQQVLKNALDILGVSAPESM